MYKKITRSSSAYCFQVLIAMHAAAIVLLSHELSNMQIDNTEARYHKLH